MKRNRKKAASAKLHRPPANENRRPTRSAMASRRDQNALDEALLGLENMSLEDQTPPIVQGTGLVYDERMTRHRSVYESESGMSENPTRITACFDKLLESGQAEKCIRVQAREATEEELIALHSQEYLEKLKATSDMNVDELKAMAENYDSISFSPKTFESALLSAGGTLELVEQVVRGKIRNGIALVRPPGHHAQYDVACGYSYLNNVALAAWHARYSWGVSRVLIVDWDVHHGQGTQYMFEDDPSVLYFSVHRYENAKYWPYLKDSNADHIGKSRGRGFNINVPLNQTGIGDSDYLAVIHQILLPVAHEFNPQLVLVSAGFDSSIGDPKGGMCLTPRGYAHLTHALMGMAAGNICLILEGGYNLEYMSKGVLACTRTLLGQPCPTLEIRPPCEGIVQTILDVISHIKKYWKSLQYQVDQIQHEEVSSSEDVANLAVSEDQEEPVVAVDTSDEAQLPDIDAKTISNDEKLSLLLENLSLSYQVKDTDIRTCFTYDEQMKKHKNRESDHPERPQRVSRIYSFMKDWNLIARMKLVASRLATKEEVTQVHDGNYVDEMERISALDEDEQAALEKSWYTARSIYFSPDTYQCALLASGSLLNVVDEVLTDRARNGVAIIRPPGHHAEIDAACGFCFFNSVPIAAKYAMKKYSLKKILILDWDVHHGNGTQNIFNEDPNVLYISLHRYDRGSFYPRSTEANYDKVGVGTGEGFNVNIAWNESKMGDSEYLAAFEQIVLPIAYEFQPELVLISAGFDAASGDPLGGYHVSPGGYAWMTHMLTSLAEGRVIMALEGGYNLHSISISMAWCTKVLLGDQCPLIKRPLLPCKDAVKSILDTLHTHKKYWKSLRFQVPIKEAKKSGKLREVSSSTTVLDPSNINKGAHDIETATADRGSSPDIDTACANNGSNGSATDNLNAAAAATSAAENTEGAQATAAVALGAEADPNTDIDKGATGFYVSPLDWCPHLEMVKPLPGPSVDIHAHCQDCDTPKENWLCLQCYQVHCGRYINEHMVFHSLESGHLLTLSFSDLSIWCYGCDSYIHNEVLIPVKQAVHFAKFGQSLPI